MTVDWSAAMAEVEHAEGCITGKFGACAPCDCDRDARIAKGIEAARASDEQRPEHGPEETYIAWCIRRDDAALAAFKEASR